MITAASTLEKMSYNELISIIGETNRPPGGLQTILNLVRTVNVTKDTKILEIGTSTGFTAVELAKRTGANITSIDINETSINIAKRNAESHGVSELISFLVADATNLPFESNSFDLIFSGNIISYIPDRERALSEYIRVLKDDGVLFATPMYYLEEPSEILVKNVRNALKMDINIDFEDYWLQFFSNPQLDLFFKDAYDFDYISDKGVKSYLNDILRTNKKYLDSQINDVGLLKEFTSLYEECLYLFRDNLSKMGYSELYFRKSTEGFDRELFTSTKRKNNRGV